MVALLSFNSFLGYVEDRENLQNKAVHIFHTCVRKYAGFKLCINHCLQKHLKPTKKISSKFWLYGQNNFALTNFNILRFQMHVENTALKFYFLWGYCGNLFSLTYVVILHKGKTHCWYYKIWRKISRGASLCIAMISKVLGVYNDERDAGSWIAWRAKQKNDSRIIHVSLLEQCSRCMHCS